MTPRDLLSAYDVRFRGAFGKPAPIVGGKDAKLAQQLLARYDFEDLRRWLDLFFTSEDAWIRGSNYSIGAFVSVLGKLIASERVTVRVETVDEDYRAMRRRVEAEQEALERVREIERARFRKGVA